MKKISIFFSILLISACATNFKTEKEKHFHTMMSKHYSQISKVKGKVYEREALLEHNKYWPSIFTKCSPEAKSNGIFRFKYVIVIDGFGKVVEFESTVDNNRISCFRDEISKMKYPTPPFHRYYQGVGVTIKK
jgi:hypothetical protein